METDQLFISSNQTLETSVNRGKALKRAAKRQGLKTADPPRKTTAERRAERKKPSKNENWHEWATPAADPMETTFRHSGWAVKRSRVRATLSQAGVSEFALNRFEQCGSEARIEWSEQEQRHRVTANYCKCRHCEPCMRSRSVKVRNNLLEKLNEDPKAQYRFTTFTLKHSTAPLQDQLKRLYRSFAKMRSRPIWKKSQAGGCFLCEVKLGEDGLWHPHLHVISAGKWLAQADLRTAWHKITGDSFVVDVRLLDRMKDAVNYVAKYVTKGCSSNVWNDSDKASEWVTASRSLRICSTFGTWRGLRLTDVKPSATDWQFVEKVSTLMQQARDGLVHAQILLAVVRGPDADEIQRQHPRPPDLPAEECPV